MEVDALSIAALLLLVGSLVAAGSARRRAARRRAEKQARARARRRKVPVVSANVRGLPSGEPDLWVDDRNSTPRKGRAA
jgi:phage protein D